MCVCVYMYVSCNRQVRESRLKLKHAVCWTQLSPILGGVWGHSTVPPLCSSVAEVDATSLLCMALPLFSGKWRPLWWLPQGLSRASCRLPPSHPSSHCFDCLLHTGEFLCTLSSWAFFLKIGICIWPSPAPLSWHPQRMCLFHLPLCKVHRGP